MEEIWKPVDGFEGYYEISNLGNLRSVDKYIRWGRNKGRIRYFPSKILSPSINNSGYKIHTLSKPGSKPVCKTIHRMVATTFIPNPHNLSDVNHIDENKNNNSVDNLEWVSHKENMIHSKSKISKALKGRGLTYDQKCMIYFMKRVIPFKFKDVKFFIYKGEVFDSREDISLYYNKTRAWVSILEKRGDIKMIKEVRVI